MSAVVELKSVPSHKDLYAMGEIPPLGHVPAKMHAWVIRKERHGPPLTSMQLEVVPTWSIGEAAAKCGLSQHTLRWYERIGTPETNAL